MKHTYLLLIVFFYAGVILPQQHAGLINCRRSPGMVLPNTDVTVRIQEIEADNIKKIQLFKKVNGVEDSITMNREARTDIASYSCVIPGISTDSAFVEYYIIATDSNSNIMISPYGNIRYSYFVLSPSKPLTIQHIRYSPYGNGWSGYNSCPVTVSGIVTSDTSSIPGSGVNNPPRVYIQNGSTPWSGINLAFRGTAGAGVYQLRVGDSVTVSGTVAFSSSSGLRIDTITALTVVSHGNDLPEPHVMKTDDVGTSELGNLTAEPWNGSIVEYNHVIIDSANADGTYNYGESFCTDRSGGNHTRITWSDGRTIFYAGPNGARIKKGDYFEGIKGILEYTHTNYKLCPSGDSDITYPDGVRQSNYSSPDKFNLQQNYPNPFNPSTTISYEIPKSGLVVMKVFNILGEEVRTVLSEVQSAGVHKITFDAGILKSGVYFYRLTADNYSSVKKLVVLK